MAGFEGGDRLSHQQLLGYSYTKCSDNAPRNVSRILCFAFKILKFITPLSTLAIEKFQDDRNRATRLFASFH